MRKYEIEKTLKNINKRYGDALYLQKSNGYFAKRWNILTCGMGTLIVSGDTLKDVWEKLIMKYAQYYGNCEYYDNELINFAKKEKLI